MTHTQIIGGGSKKRGDRFEGPTYQKPHDCNVSQGPNRKLEETPENT